MKARTPAAHHNGVRFIMGGISALIAGGVVLTLEMWTIVPAPNLTTLVLAAFVPEVTPWAIVACLIAAAVAQLWARGWARNVGLFCAALALGWAIVPWCLLPATVSTSERELRLGLGNAPARPPTNAHWQGLERPYDVRLALFGYRSAGAVSYHPDLPVRTRDGQRLGLDLYAPAAPGPHPAIIVIYGGAWVFGSRAASAELATSLAGLGYTAIAIDYRHAPAYQFPTQIDDVHDALATIARNAKAWNVDRHRVAILGRSAGAELALIAAYDRGPLTIRAAIGYYAPIDLIAGYRIPPQPDPADVARILRTYVGGTPDERPSAYVAASPLAHIRPGLPPTLLIGGERDELVRLGFQHEMRDALRAEHDRVVAIDLPWSNHAFDTIANGTGGQLARYFTEQFLARTL